MGSPNHLLGDDGPQPSSLGCAHGGGSSPLQAHSGLMPMLDTSGPMGGGGLQPMVGGGGGYALDATHVPGEQQQQAMQQQQHQQQQLLAAAALAAGLPMSGMSQQQQQQQSALQGMATGMSPYGKSPEQLPGSQLPAGYGSGPTGLGIGGGAGSVPFTNPQMAAALMALNQGGGQQMGGGGGSQRGSQANSVPNPISELLWADALVCFDLIFHHVSKTSPDAS